MMDLKVNFAAKLNAEPDHESIALCFTGGLKAWNTAENAWSISPVLYQGEVSGIGKFGTFELKNALDAMDYRPVLYERTTCMDGQFAVTYRPFHPNPPTGQLFGADLWQTMGNNLKRLRMAEFSKVNPEASHNLRDKAMDASSPEERLISSISDSIRSMDICLGAICNFYHDQLVSAIRKGKKPYQRFSNISDLPFVANVHSFFLHFGAAFGYFGALLARRCGMPEKVDDLTRLIGELRSDLMPGDLMLRALLEVGVMSSIQGSKRYKLDGWLESAIKVRNDFVHKRPYGSKRSEEWGSIKPVEGGELFFKYFRSIEVEGKPAQDTLEFISALYLRSMRLFERLHAGSGYDATIPHFTDKDFLSIKINNGGPSGV